MRPYPDAAHIAHAPGLRPEGAGHGRADRGKCRG